MSGVLGANVVAFGRILRRAGLPIGTGQIIASAEALRPLDLGERRDVRAALHATFVTHHTQTVIFDQAFAQYWRYQSELDAQIAAMLPQTILPPDQSPPAGARRLSEAFNSVRRDERSAELEIWADTAGTTSEIEILKGKDFAQMSVGELSAAKRALEQLHWRLKPKPSRRFQPASHGRVDARRTLRAMLRTHGEALTLRYFARRESEPPLVALVDISGSMSEYSRVVLHFLHGLSKAGARDGRRITTFLFGTRLTNATRALKNRDIDDALSAVSALAPDWDGGTRIGQALAVFNRHWARRVLTQGAHVLLITDGLEREDPEMLAREADRLKRSARGITWANPLLRYADFSPKAQGMRALLPHIDTLKPMHNLNTVMDLAKALGAT